MARERVSNKRFFDAHIVLSEALDAPLSPAGLFGRTAPLEVDLGCGRGRFLLARARSNPDKNFLGVDRLLLRLRKLDRRAVAEGLTNIRLVQGDAAHVTASLLPVHSVRTFYVFFPDPWPKRRHHRRRLISPPFVERLWQILEPDGLLHIATDHSDYMDAIRALLDADNRFESADPFVPTDEEETDFGLIFRKQGLSPFRRSYRKRVAEAR